MAKLAWALIWLVLVATGDGQVDPDTASEYELDSPKQHSQLDEDDTSDEGQARQAEQQLHTLSNAGGDSGRHEKTWQLRLERTGDRQMYWKVNHEAREVSIEVHATLADQQWFAIGFSDYGSNMDADLCVLWVDWKGHTHFQDAYTDGDGRMHLDSEQDCEDFRSRRDGNVTKFAFRRQWDTCDPHDYVLQEGTTHVVWGAGNGPLYRLEGVLLEHPLDEESGAAHGRECCAGLVRVQLLKPAAAPLDSEHPPNSRPLDVRAQRVKVPHTDTTYWCHVQRLPPQLRNKHHVFKYEAVVDPGNEALVHHMEVFHCEAGPNEEIPEYRGPCDSPGRPEATQVCNRVVAAWAIGAGGFAYPEQAGLPLGGPRFNPYVRLEIHYNNPEKKSDWVDSSGIRFWISPRLRPNDAGVMELGLEYIDKMAIPPGQDAFPLAGHCIPECTALGLPAGGIHIFGSQLHTHLTGVRVSTRHVRDGKELPFLNHDEHYSTTFQEIRLLPKPVHIRPGDGLITTCWYKTADRVNVTLGGFAISDEMCVNYVHYYPRVDLEVCKSSISWSALGAYFRFLRDWDAQPTVDGGPVSGNYGAVSDWTPLRVQVLSDLYAGSPLSMQCNRSDGVRFPGDWEDLPTVQVSLPLPPTGRDCPGQEQPTEKRLVHPSGSRGVSDEEENQAEVDEVPIAEAGASLIKRAMHVHPMGR